MRLFRSICAVAVAAALGSIPLDAARAQDAFLAELEEFLAPYRELPMFEAPGPAFDAKSCVAGKSMMAMPASSAIPFMNDIQGSMERIADEVGLAYQHWRNQGQSSQWVQGVNAAINQKADLIDLCCGLDPTTLAPQLTEASAAGIPVVASHMTGFEYELPSYVTEDVPADFYRVGELLASWVTLKTDRDANVLVVTANEVVSTTPLVEGFKVKMAEICPDCQAKYINVPVPDWATRIQSNVQSSLLADPGVNYIVPIYDSMVQFVLPALRLTGKQDAVKVATFNGTPFALDLVREGQVEMNIGESLDWIAHAIMDTDMRLLCGLDVPDDPKIPLYIFDADNVETAGVPATINAGYGDSYQRGYRALWGLE